MLRRLALGASLAACVGAAGGFALYAVSLPMLRRLPKERHISLDGITTIEDATAMCRRSGLRGWDLVAYAQHLVARKFTYSRLNTWDSPARAFERGMGYCEQQALSLHQIYQALGIRSRPVFALGCRFPPQEIDGMPWSGGITGHAWLRVTIGRDTRDVCPGSVANVPGITPFQVLSPVHTLSPWLRPFTHFGSALTNVQRDAAARRAMRRRALTRTAPADVALIRDACETTARSW